MKIQILKQVGFTTLHSENTLRRLMEGLFLRDTLSTVSFQELTAVNGMKLFFTEIGVVELVGA